MAVVPDSKAKRLDVNIVMSVIGIVMNLAAIAIAYQTLFASIDATRQSVEQTNKALDQSTLATIYELSQSSHAFMTDDPDVAIHFDKYYQESKTEQQLLELFETAPLKTKIRIWAGCETIADFMQLCFAQEKLIPREDWDNWLTYFCDMYSESPVFRNFLKERSTWYSFEEKLIKSCETKLQNR